MVLTARAGTSMQRAPALVPGVEDGVSFRTNLSAPDDGQNWAFAFAKGSMFVIRTDRTNGSEYAFFIAKAIIDHF